MDRNITRAAAVRKRKNILLLILTFKIDWPIHVKLLFNLLDHWNVRVESFYRPYFYPRPRHLNFKKKPS